MIRWHLSGHGPDGQPFVAGVYPLLLDETCCFLAIDFDKANWHQDATALLEVCGQLQVPAALERSRSGRGGHVWLFFEDVLPAALVRRLGSHLLTEAMEGRPDIGFDSYDRLFPNQDTLPHGGFGNLIALPLQRGPREKGNSVFLDEDGEPWPDQWAFLARIARIPRARVERIVQEAEQRGRILGVKLPPQEDGEHEPWTAPPSGRRRVTALAGDLPESLELVLGHQIYIPKTPLPPALRNRLLRLSAFQNPEFYKAQAVRLSTFGRPRVIACAEEFPEHIGLPRGCLDEICEVLTDLRIAPIIRDERYGGRPLQVRFQGELRTEQQRAAEAMLAHDIGVLAATTAFGKTVIAAWLIAQRGVSTLVLVHRRQLLDQWLERLSAFLHLPAKSIGRIGGGRSRPTGQLDVGLIQSFVRKGVVDDRVGDYGHLVVDECHHLSAHSFERVARQAKARFVTGLSATIARKDGHHPIIFMQCGPVRYRVNAKAQAAIRPFEHVVLVQPTSFHPRRAPESDKRLEFQALYQELIDDELRHRCICDDVIDAVRAGRSPLVLTERNEHLNRLEASLAAPVPRLEAIGYSILLPASAIPGWPADVPLPSDPVWKRDYAASVQRLVRDGIDIPLASLFVHVARTVLPDAEGADRARSASEAFLYRRLQTLPETKERFRLNASLPIAFDGTGALEVDLLCDDARVAVELDGAQHLSDPAAYRRDRRKDQLLQENGYLVLRFLAEDVGKELDLVLDGIVRAVNHRSSLSSIANITTMPAMLRMAGVPARR